MEVFDAKIDVRELQRADRIGTIYSTFDSLAPGQQMEIINDHDPVHLHEKLDIDRGGQFDWKYLAEGPDVWRIVIRKL
jgi:uncharacterized protein (DUF2249 family)